MSTRCNVVFKNKTKVMQLYHHHDGYPEGVGEELQKFINKYEGEKEPYAMAAGLNDYDDSYELEGKLNLHRDIEYLYVVDTDKKQVTCYLVFIGKGIIDEDMVGGKYIGQKVKSHFVDKEYDAQIKVYDADFSQPFDEIKIEEK